MGERVGEGAIGLARACCCCCCCCCCCEEDGGGGDEGCCEVAVVGAVDMLTCHNQRGEGLD